MFITPFLLKCSQVQTVNLNMCRNSGIFFCWCCELRVPVQEKCNRKGRNRYLYLNLCDQRRFKKSQMLQYVATVFHPFYFLRVFIQPLSILLSRCRLISPAAYLEQLNSSNYSFCLPPIAYLGQQ